MHLASFRCFFGLHRWRFMDEREGDNVTTWAWCRNAHCPRFAKPRRVNVDFSPLPRDRHEA